MKLNEFIEKYHDRISLNIFNESFKEDKIIEACRDAKEKKFANIATLKTFIDLVWEHSEKLNILNSIFLNNFDKKYCDEELFVEVKKLSLKGVVSIGYIPPKNFTIKYLERDIQIITKAKQKKINIFIILNNSDFNDINFVKEVIYIILSTPQISGIKISSGIKNERGNSFNTNIILDCIKKSKRRDFKVASCLNLFDKNNFLEAENVRRLASIILGEKWAEENLYYIFDYDELKSQGVFN